MKRKSHVGKTTSSHSQKRCKAQKGESLPLTKLTLSLPENYSFSESICSYGYFTLPPNLWTPAPPERHKDDGCSLTRPLRFGDKDEHAALCRIGLTVPDSRRVEVEILQSSAPLQHEDGESLLRQVNRILRTECDRSQFWSKHPEAKARGWGRTYRGPSLWEDCIKTITNCNMQWRGTVEMNRKLCADLGTPLSAFPTPHELIQFTPDELKSKCRLGYRAAWVHQLAQGIVSGEVDLAVLERLPAKELTKAVRRLSGFGPFAANNLLHLCGHFEAFPYDTETVRLWKEEKGGCKDKADAERKARQHYAYLAPYQWQGYWFDLWRNYERRNRAEATRWGDFDAVAKQFSAKVAATK